MNEKLKSMLQKAGAITSEYYRNLDNSASYSKSIVDGWSEDFREQLRLEPYLRVKEMDEGTLEKFAELLIQECISKYEELEDAVVIYRLGGDNTGEIAKSELIKKHFGVSE